MTLYYLRLATISLQKNWGQTALMVLAIGLGIGVCMSIVTINYLMAKDPIPDKSHQLFYVQLDNWDPNRPAQSPNEPPDQITWMDHQALMSAGKAFRQTGNARATAVIRKPDDQDFKPFLASIRGSHADFFEMFNVPFLFGSGWSADAHHDWGAEAVVVLSRETNDRLFGGEDSIGREITIGEPSDAGSNLYRVIGVLDEWRPVPKFYDLTNNYFSNPADVFIPFGRILSQGLSRSGNTNCWKPTGDGLRAFLGSECVWIQYWAELRDSQEKADYMAYLNQYVTEQKEGGRFPRPLNNRLNDVNEWLDHENVVQPEAKMMLAVAVMFLVVCLLNTIGLLLSKFVGKSTEIGVRRALGVSRGSLFYQYLVETALIGLAGGILGLLLTWLGLESMHAIFGSEAANLMRLDLNMVVAAVVLAIASSIGAGLYPTWRACNIDPAAQLKSQ